MKIERMSYAIRSRVLTCVGLLLLSAAVAADAVGGQPGAPGGTPGFAGKWVPDPSGMPGGAPAGAAGGGARGGLGAPIVITETPTTVTIERRVGENTISQTYKLDGSESANVIPGRGGEVTVTSRARWEGDKLVITTRQPGPDGATMESMQTLSVQNGALVIETTREGRQGGPVTTKIVYKRSDIPAIR